jgi:hypothetical protein
MENIKSQLFENSPQSQSKKTENWNFMNEEDNLNDELGEQDLEQINGGNPLTLVRLGYKAYKAGKATGRLISHLNGDSCGE